MIEYFVVCNEAGDVLWRGEGTRGAAAVQQLDAGLMAVVVPKASILTPVFDIEPYRAWKCVEIDSDAEFVRQQFITPGAGQALTYQRKEAEARAWTAETPESDVPMLAAEAAATGVPIAAVAAAVIVAADAWLSVGAAIEGLRLGAKKAVTEAGTIPAILAAAVVNWTLVGA